MTSLAIPLVMGHQFGGVVETVGENVSTDIIARQAAVMPLLSCGICEFCHSGRENLCDQFAYYGLLGADGGFAQYAAVKKENIIFTENSSILTFMEPILVGIHAASKIGEWLSTDRVLILGAGAIGIALAAVLRDIYGANVFVYDILPNRLRTTASAGFQVIRKEDLSSARFGIVFDCAGSDPMSQDAALIQGFDLVEKGGVLVGLGSYFHPLPVTPIKWLLSETTIINSFAYDSGDVARLPEILEKLQVDFSLFCDSVQLDNIIEDGFYRSEIDKDSFTRLVVKC